MKKREKLFSLTRKDFKFVPFGASSKGGQHANRNKCYMRCTHEASGAVGLGQKYKSQKQNKKLAFRNMANTEKFKKWIRSKGLRMMGVIGQIEAEIDMSLKNPRETKVEVKDENGRWVEV